MKTLASVLAALALIVGIVAAQLSMDRHAVREQNSILSARVAALESAQAAGNAPVAAATLPQSIAAPPDGTSMSSGTTQTPPKDANQLRAGVLESLNTPQGRELVRTMAMTSLRQRYPDLAKELNLSPLQAEAFLQLLAKQQTEMGTDISLSQAGATQDRAAMQEQARKRAEKQQANETELASMLGGNYQRWKEYQRTSSTRQQANAERQQMEELRYTLGSGDVPLSEAKAKPLFAAISAEEKRIQQEVGGLSIQRQLERRTEDNRRLVTVAAAHLDADQLERYKLHLEQQSAMMRAVSGAMGATGAAGN